MYVNFSQVLSCTDEGMCMGGGGVGFDRFYHSLNFMFDF